MVNVLKLKGKVVENGLNLSEVAKAIHIDRCTLSRKLGGSGEDFTIKQADELTKLLNLTADEAMSIFLASMSQKCDNF
nr:MAG TPA: LAMBDA REPRESSOR (TRIPLE MUTANT)/DNA COMPLEX-DNA COMPLEX, DOUBLE HELIX, TRANSCRIPTION-DNA.1A [Caudoviricetes sp.]